MSWTTELSNRKLLQKISAHNKTQKTILFLERAEQAEMNKI